MVWKKGFAIILGLLTVISLMPFISAQEGNNIVILVSDNEADSAVAENVGGLLGAQIVTTTWGLYDPQISAQIIEKEPDLVIIIGGEVAVPEEYEEDLDDMEIEVIRWAGKNREETSLDVIKGMKEYFPNILEQVDELYLIDGREAVSYKTIKLIKEYEGSPSQILIAFVNYNSKDFEEQLEEVIHTAEAENIVLPVLMYGRNNVFSGHSKTMELALQYGQSSGVSLSIINISLKEDYVLEVIHLAENRILEAKDTLDGLEEPKAKAMIKLAEKEIEEARDAYDKGDYQKAYIKAMTAKGHAEIALRSSNEMLRGIFQGSMGFALEHQLTRLKWMMIGLRNTGVDVGEIEQLLNSAELALKQHKYDEAQEIIEDIKEKLKESFKYKKEKSEEHMPVTPPKPGDRKEKP
ncbi:hypothetical protein PAP_05800 [Palaeococcus pacificus DY20341]|uniref:Cell wall-binding repeat 2 family protein n=1 Tax=Palaeococcus pacificus DY20341 TaxID=1343739 RepID=A0A075LS19_9EURY|nr:hypothetical protein [Palaeococcus pacificus]AIF69560.1 hypothetical protein PAP_05800 [Palaeococcus pacificus DY20341]